MSDEMKQYLASIQPTPIKEVFVPSKHQKDIFTWIREGQGHGVIEGVAGCGKTTTLIKSIEHCHATSPGRILFTTFTKNIAEELKRRIPQGINCAAYTLNAFGWTEICRKQMPAVKLDRFKDDGILKRLVNPDMEKERYYRLKNPVLRMVSLIKAINGNTKDYEKIASDYGVELGDIKPMDRFADVLADVYRSSITNIQTMSFDDQVFQPIHRNWPIPSYKWVLVDECQDLSPIQIELVRRLSQFGRLILVGDPDQCQPTGTMVSVRSGVGGTEVHQIPIEQLQKGYEVVSSDSKGEWRINAINEVSFRPYDGELVVIETEDGKKSRYTPNHRCFVDFAMLRYSWCVYLMRSGTHFRIGKSAMITNKGINSGLATRMRAEGATEGWILSIHGGSQDAWIAEQIASIKFNIPQLVFRHTNLHMHIKPDLNMMWREIGNNTAKAEKCLQAHGRMLEFPLIKDSLTDWKAGLNRTIKTQACNLMDGCRVIQLDWQHRTHGSMPHNRAKPEDYKAITVTREHYTGDVFSLSVERDKNYVADGIKTSNSIYLFRGAHPDAMGTVAAELSATQLPLSVCYRCKPAIVESAQKQVPRITNAPGSEGGIVEWITTEDFLREVSPGDLVLSRTTAPLVKRCLEFIRNGVKAYVKGRDVGQGLITLIEKIHGNPDQLADDYYALYTQTKEPHASDIAAFLLQVDEYYTTNAARLERANRETELINLEMNIETIKVLAENNDFVAQIIHEIEQIFADNDDRTAIMFMTGHKAKGLENERVYILRLDQCPHPRAKTDNAKRQEKNLLYVMKTRAQNELYFVKKSEDEK